ncbi:MAG: EF-hand domain-containing protein [Planctomycetota bacterium]
MSQRKHNHNRRGSAVILAMMFMVIFGSLAAAMAIVSEGNLYTARSHAKVNRAQAAAETGMALIETRLELASEQVLTDDGYIDAADAPVIWQALVDELTGIGTEFPASVVDEPHFDGENPYLDYYNEGEPEAGEGATTLVIPWMVMRAPDEFNNAAATESSAAAFQVRLTQHPLADTSIYDSGAYQRPPYQDADDYEALGLDAPVSSANPLDERFVRVRVIGRDGPASDRLVRVVARDFKIGKTIPFALLSRSRVMVGKNVEINGPIGSRFTETNLTNGHPIQVVSDFRGILADLDADLDALTGSIINDDLDGDNRLRVGNSAETAGYADAESFDTDGDGYIDEFDFFLARFDTNGDNKVSLTELEAHQSTDDAAQLMELIDQGGSDARFGYNDGFLDTDDLYAKINGEIHIRVDQAGWNSGAAGGDYRDYLQGPVTPGQGEAAVTFQSGETEKYVFEPEDFNTSSFRDLTDSDLLTQAVAESAGNDPLDPTSPSTVGDSVTEAVPFGAEVPYDWYDRPVFRNMTFRDVRIPPGSNALFENCRFIGVTYIETETNNTDPNFNYAGMNLNQDLDPKYPGLTADVEGAAEGDTKLISNNLRFHNCTFEGAIVSDSPKEFTQVRNKVAFTGTTEFEIEESTALTDDEKDLYSRSSLLLPNYSVEMGTFIAPYDAQEQVNLSGAIVVGLADLRGKVEINGSLVSTFEPQSNTGPVIGANSPNFNTTLGYFTEAEGDLESRDIVREGWGVIRLNYDPSIPLPDGITGPVDIAPVTGSYTEGGES